VTVYHITRISIRTIVFFFTSTRRNTIISMEQYVIYNEEYHMIICKPCGYAVKSDWIERHLQEKHKELKIKVRRELVEYVKELKQSTMVVTPSDGCRAIIGLHMVKGYECEDCRYLCPKLSSMQEHCKRNHDWKKAMGIKWTECQLQTWFPSRNRKYFKVISETLTSTVTELQLNDLLITQKEKEAVEEKEIMVVSKEQDKRERTPWLNKTGWLEVFAGKDMDRLAKSVKKPSKLDAELWLVYERTEAVLRRCIEGVKDCRRREWTIVLRWLNGVELGKPDVRPFTVQHEANTIGRYLRNWQCLICFCVRAFEAEDKVCFLRC